MEYDREELKEERRGLVRWLLAVAFGRRKAADHEDGKKVRRIGTINRLL